MHSLEENVDTAWKVFLEEAFDNCRYVLARAPSVALRAKTRHMVELVGSLPAWSCLLLDRGWLRTMNR